MENVFDIITFMMKDDYITKEYFNHILDKKFDLFEERIEKKFDDFAIIVARGFAEVGEKFKEQREYMDETFATKLDLYETESRLNGRFDKLEGRVEKIESHIGRMDIRFSNIDEIVRLDHTPRIKNLEAAVGV